MARRLSRLIPLLEAVHPAYLSVAAWVVRVAIIVVSGTAAFLLRFDFALPPGVRLELAWGLLTWLLVKPAVYLVRSVDQTRWRDFSSRDVLPLVTTQVIASAVSAAALAVAGPPGFPRSVYLIDALIATALSVGARFAVRHLLDAPLPPKPGAPITVIYGAGAAGRLLLRETRTNRDLQRRVFGFIDDDSRKIGHRIDGLEVLGPGSLLGELARRNLVDEVLVAAPAASPSARKRMLAHCYSAGLPCRSMPSLAEVLCGSSGLLNEIRTEDLLGRCRSELTGAAAARELAGRKVLVTGAAGSIGSELCRQIARCSPAELIAFDLCETPLFFLERELLGGTPSLNLRCFLGNVQNPRRLRDVFEAHSPDIVFHAAAYKHVPLMEEHAFEAVENNILGTWNVAGLAAEFGSEAFVMVSTDKAVRPTNVMGASKRVAELIVRSMQGTRCRFVSVRFGNVLGSNGSVVPVFRKQIADGGPVTVTHPEMRRYFMTIPEAVELVIHASTLGSGGEIFVLDMGQPVRILDLARNMIRMSGLRPDIDVRIEFTGLRPGEKLFEELRLDSEAISRTPHPQIHVFRGHSPEPALIRCSVERFQDLCAARDLDGTIRLLMELVPDYVPATTLQPRHLPVAAADYESAMASLANLAAAVRGSGVPAPSREVVLP